MNEIPLPYHQPLPPPQAGAQLPCPLSVAAIRRAFAARLAADRFDGAPPHTGRYGATSMRPSQRT